MNAGIELPPAREVCPTTTRRLLGEGALLVDVRELGEVATTAFDVPGVVLMPLSELEQRYERTAARPPARAGQQRRRAQPEGDLLPHVPRLRRRSAHMEGGMAKWARKGFPIRGAVPAGIATAGLLRRPGPRGRGCSDGS